MWLLDLRATTMPASQAATLADLVVNRGQNKITKKKIARYNKCIVEAIREGKHCADFSIKEENFNVDQFFNHFLNLGYKLSITADEYRRGKRIIIISW